MVYLQLMLGLGVVIAAATAIYFSIPERASQHRTHSQNHSPQDRNDFDNDNGKAFRKGERRFRNSKPGDKCLICLQEMTAETMHTMHCGHAICKGSCFKDYRQWNRQCPHCNQIVLRIDLPGDDCSICCEAMLLETMEYLNCEHALHKTCLLKLRKNNYTDCPICKRSL